MFEGEQERTPTADELAQHFPQLEILQLLEQGATGTLYKARHPRLNGLVALRILPAELGQDRASVERFTREASALAKLSHENIVAIHDVGSEGLCFLLMEFVEGMSLRQLLQSGPIEPSRALAIVRQIGQALQYAHHQGIVHGDLKPENIFIDAKRTVKVADFGLTELLNHDRADQGADLYSVGLVFYEMLTGQPPLGYSALPSQKAQVDARLDAVVDRMLHQEPQLRYQRVEELMADLQQIRFDPPAPARRKNRRGPLIAAAALVAVVYGFLVVPAIREAWPGLNWLRRQATRPRQSRNAMRFIPLGDRAAQEAPRLGKITRDGPVLSEVDASRLGFQPEQLFLVNAVLKISFQEYLQLEREHAKQELNDKGHLVTTIASFPAEFEQLENRIWSKLGQILDEQQQSNARTQLPLRPTQASPGFFGWGGAETRIKTWREGATYHWTLAVGESTVTQSAPQLPEELQRFWDDAG